MKDFVAITASGGVYRVQNGFLSYQGAQGDYSFKLLSVKSVDRTSLDLSWEYLSVIPDINTIPEKGLSMYLEGPDEWRITTPVVEVYQIEPDL